MTAPANRRRTGKEKGLALDFPKQDPGTAPTLRTSKRARRLAALRKRKAASRDDGEDSP